jgi:hypothetical protein
MVQTCPRSLSKIKDMLESLHLILRLVILTLRHKTVTKLTLKQEGASTLNLV